jgi:alanyl-tRNA synthetase
VRFGRQQLGLSEPFMHQLVPVIVDSMGAAFPELKRDPRRVAELINGEEASFGRTLSRGLELFDEAVNDAGNELLHEKKEHRDEAFWNLISFETKRLGITSGFQPRQLNWGSFPENQRPQIAAADAFKLHDTYGFPIDLTRIMAEERGLSVDLPGYEKLMEHAKDLARSGGKSDDATKRLTELPPAALSQLSQAGVTPTDDKPKYGREPITAQVLAIWNGDDLGLSRRPPPRTNPSRSSSTGRTSTPRWAARSATSACWTRGRNPRGAGG